MGCRCAGIVIVGIVRNGGSEEEGGEIERGSHIDYEVVSCFGKLQPDASAIRCDFAERILFKYSIRARCTNAADGQLELSMI